MNFVGRLDAILQIATAEVARIVTNVQVPMQTTKILQENLISPRV